MMGILEEKQDEIEELKYKLEQKDQILEGIVQREVDNKSQATQREAQILTSAESRISELETIVRQQAQEIRKLVDKTMTSESQLKQAQTEIRKLQSESKPIFSFRPEGT